MKRFVLAMMAVAAMAAAPRAAEAAIIIDFAGQGASGSLVSLGSGHYAGTGIRIDTLLAIGTPIAGQWAVTGTNGGFASLDFNTLTNTITITGAIAGLGVGQSTLLTGSFAFWGTGGGGSVLSFDGGGPDTKSRELLLALGMDPTTPFEFYGFTIASNLTGGGYVPFSTDISNTAVPEPGSMLLLGTGLLGLAAVARRRMRKA